MISVIYNPTVRAATLCLAVVGFLPVVARAAPPAPTKAFLKSYCFDCHDSDTHESGLDLEKLRFDLNEPAIFRTWVKVHDKISTGKMPPPEGKRPPQAETAAALRELDQALIAADRARQQGGRAVFRRLNRTEYENSLRDLLLLPGLSVRDLLPEDGQALGFDKAGTALDFSFVQLNKYLEAADAALDVAVAPIAEKPTLFSKRLYPAFEWSFGHLLADDGDAVLLKDLKYDDDPYPVVRDYATLKLAKEKLAKIAASYTGAVGSSGTPTRTISFPSGGRFNAHYPGRYRLGEVFGLGASSGTRGKSSPHGGPKWSACWPRGACWATSMPPRSRRLSTRSRFG